MAAVVFSGGAVLLPSPWTGEATCDDNAFFSFARTLILVALIFVLSSHYFFRQGEVREHFRTANVVCFISSFSDR